MDMKKNIQNSIKMTMRREDIMTFITGLHDIQQDMIETVVQQREREGFPEAHLVIQHIMSKK